MRNFLKFSYFFIILIGFSCGDTKTKKQDSKTDSEVTVETNENTETGTKTILFFGNSLTAGYGLDTEESFPSLIQDRLDSLNLDYEVINAGLSGETTSGGKNRLEWVLNQKVDVFVLELGANDGLRGIDIKETQKNLEAAVKLAIDKGMVVVLSTTSS